MPFQNVALRRLRVSSGKFGFDLLPVLKNADINVYLPPTPTDKAGRDLATIQSGVRDGNYYADLHILSPSTIIGDCCTNVGEYFDANYVAKTLAHEFSSILLDNTTRQKEKGWSFYSAPSWFVQGYEEYLGLTQSTDHTLNITLEKYKQTLRQSPTNIYVGEFGIDTQDVYIDGALLVLFLHETFGKEKVQAVLASPKRTFFGAFETELGVTFDELAQRWNEWLETL